MRNTKSSSKLIGLTLLVLLLSLGVSISESKLAVVKTAEPSGSVDGFTAVPVVIETEVPFAGIQIVLSYDPTTLIIGKPRSSDRTSGMTLASHDRDGEVIILVYSPEGNTIAAGSGPIFTIPVEMPDNINQASKFELRFEEVILGDISGQSIPVETESIILKTIPLPTEFTLEQNYPNPFNPVTSIEYSLPEAANVKIEVYNLLGQVVDVLFNSEQEAGHHAVQWDASDLASGVYFYRLTAGDFTATKRMVLMK